jgi:4-azaleucine resistance transporter AzlC
VPPWEAVHPNAGAGPSCEPGTLAAVSAPAWLGPEQRPVVAAGVTLGAVVGVFGVVFGVGAVAAGGSVAQAGAMSLLVFTGASQFSAVSVIEGGGSPGSAFASAMLLAVRNGVYGLTLSRHLGGTTPTRLLAAHLTIDESTAMATAQSTSYATRVAFWVTGASVFVFWNLGTLLGALAGTAIDPETYGLDAAFPAGFVAMVAPQFRTPNGRVAGLVGGAVCLVTIPFVPVGMSILCASVAVLVGVRRPEPTAPRVDGPEGGGGVAS